MKKAFTLAEAILTMTILGIIAAIMITTLKPNQYRTQAFTTLKKKAYAAVDEVTQTIIADCTKGMKLTLIYPSCSKTSTPAEFSSATNEIFALFMRGTTAAENAAATGCTAKTGYSNLKLRNGICMYFKKTVDGDQIGEIFIDVNGEEGPNDTTDQFTIRLSDSDIMDDMPQ